MKYKSMRNLLLLTIASFMVGMVLHSCANRGYPEGGPKDSVPPVVIEEVPATYSTNFDKKHINIYFDEFVQLKDINEKFIISPAQNKKPKVRLKGKYIQVEFQDTLKPNVTYSLDFADAIVDNNEGNPLGFYRYVFSTGSQIDTLELAGQVVNAESGYGVLGAFVFLYEENRDSIPLEQIPDYIARTDSMGNFRLTNLREADYLVLAVKDENRDTKFTPEAEAVGFIDSLIRPQAINTFRYDTVTKVVKVVGNDTIVSDSVFRTDFTAYGPSNLYIRMFKEELSQLYMTDDARKERRALDFTFSIPAENKLEVRLLNAETTADWFIKERNITNDTIRYWLRDTTVVRKDSLLAELRYLKTDSTGNRVIQIDTNRYNFKDKVVNAKKNKKKDEEEQPKMTFVSINSNVTSSFDIEQDMRLTFSEPIEADSLKNIRLYEQVDSTQVAVPFTLVHDSLRIRNYTLQAKLKPGSSYELKIDSAQITNIYGEHNNKFDVPFKIKEEREYGRIILNVAGVTGNTIIQLYKDEDKKPKDGEIDYKIVRETIIDKDGVVDMKYLPEGKYKVRAILDKNGNNKWDTGNYLKRIQPETFIYSSTLFNVKKNFDVEQNFDLSELKEK